MNRTYAEQQAALNERIVETATAPSTVAKAKQNVDLWLHIAGQEPKYGTLPTGCDYCGKPLTPSQVMYDSPQCANAAIERDALRQAEKNAERKARWAEEAAAQHAAKNGAAS